MANDVTPAEQLARQITGPLEAMALAPFDEWEYDDAANEVRKATIVDYDVRRAYAVEKDHFQNGSEWVGPGDATTNLKIQQQFAPEDAVGEVLSNVSNAFLEPQITVAPIEDVPEGASIPPATQAIMDEAITLLTNWWDRVRLHEHLQNRVQTSAWAGSAALRLWIPWRYLLTNGDFVFIRSTNDFEEALSYIHVSSHLPEFCVILTDSSTQDKIAVFLDEETIQNGDSRETVKRAELVYLDPAREIDQDADTIIRIVYSDDKRPDSVARLQLGGRLTIAEMRTPVLITEPVLRTQRQLNFLTTISTRIAETAAFRERYITNAKPQGTRYTYTPGEPLQDGAFLERDDEGNLWQVIPQPRTLGAATSTELIGLEQRTEVGDLKGNQTPGVHVIEPVDPKPYLEAADSVRRRILRMCSQGHLGGISNAESSGIAYEQARAVFEKDLNRRRVPEEGMLRDLLMALLALAEDITDRRGYFTEKIRVVVDQHVNAGPRSPDLVRLDLESYDAGAMSIETLLSKIGVEDVEAELLRIQRSPTYALKILKDITAAGGDKFTPESLKSLAVGLGLPANIVNVLVEQEEPAPVVPPTA